MSVDMAQHERSRALRVSDLLQHVDYRIAEDEQDRKRVFHLRYEAYLREEAIDPNPLNLFSDDHDHRDNCWIFGLFEDEWLLSSIRVHVIRPEARYGPAMDVFGDILDPILNQGKTLIDPTRFVADEIAAREYPDLPFLTLRVACMASEFFQADYCLATVRKEHAAFYRRVFKSEVLCEPRPYPSLAQPICLLRANVRCIRDALMARYPVFLSSFTERRMLFHRNRADIRQLRSFPRLVESDLAAG